KLISVVIERDQLDFIFTGRDTGHADLPRIATRLLEGLFADDIASGAADQHKLVAVGHVRIIVEEFDIQRERRQVFHRWIDAEVYNDRRWRRRRRDGRRQGWRLRVRRRRRQ